MDTGKAYDGLSLAGEYFRMFLKRSASWAVQITAFWVVALLAPAQAFPAQWLSLGVSHESYFANQESLYGLQDYQLFQARYFGEASAKKGGEASGSWIGARLEVGGIYSTSVANYSALYAPEAFVQFRQRSFGWLPQEVSFGRMKESWSQLDESWELGLVQPLFRFDYLRPEQQGLTGMFVTWKGQNARFVLFGSYVYLPEQGPPFKLENGVISSASPWFTAPTNSLILFEQPTEIRYRIETPEISDVVLRGSAGGLFVLGERTAGGPWSSGGYINKPRNSLMLPFTAPFVLFPTDQVAQVTVFPRVERHHLAVLDVGYRTGGTAGFVSALAEFPDNPLVGTNFTRQTMEPQFLVSPGFEARLFPNSSWGPRAQIAYLHQDGGETAEEGPFATDRGTIFGHRMNFTRAASLELKSNLYRERERTLDVKLRWVEDFRQRGTLLMSEVRFVPVDNWVLTFLADFLGSAAEPNERNGLINRYRGNDRVAGAVSYVF